MPKLKKRRGVTLVLMAFMFTVLIGAAAFAVDFGRMFMYRTQLSSAADAAALAGIWQVLHKAPLPDSAVNQAKSFALRHKVGPDIVSLDDADIRPGRWPLPSGPFTETAWDDAGLNAIQVATRTRTSATQDFFFGRVLGFNSHTVRDTAVAAWAYVGVTSCVRPVAIPYQSLLNQISPKDADGNPIWDITHDLTPEDVVTLQNAGPADALPLKLGGDATAGNFYLVNLGPYADPNGVLYSPGPSVVGQPVFSDQFGGDCSHSPWSIHPNDWLQGRTGNADGPTQAGFEELCGGNITGTGTFPCNPVDPEKAKIKIALWATEDDGFCKPRCFQVKMVGVFVVTGYTKTSSGDDGILGYFSSIPTTGSFTNVPTPITKIGLVK